MPRKINQNIANEIVFEKCVNKNYTYEPFEYTTAVKTKIKLTCHCGCKWETTYNTFINSNTGCKSCGLGHNRLTQDDFIKKSIQTHGDFYDYSKAKYIKNNIPVIIIDPEYGEFEQTPSIHMRGGKHPTRSYRERSNGRKSKTLEKFIEEATKIHSNEYQYHETIYVNSSTKVKIYDPVHKKFFYQYPYSHLSGTGSPFRTNNIKQTTIEFIEKSKELYGNDSYDYSFVEYKNNHTKVTLICKKTGVKFQQTPSGHLSGRKYRVKENTESFIKRAKEIHGEKYCYNNTSYVNNSTPVEIYDNELNEIFFQRPDVHLRGGENPTRRVDKIKNKQRWTVEKFITAARKVHGNLYDYSLVTYNGALEKIVIVDPEYGIFEQTAASHLSGCGHPSRGVYGYDQNNKGYFYIHEITSTISSKKYYKIGITKNINQRLSQYRKNVLQTNKFKVFFCNDGKVVQELERYIKKNSGINIGVLSKSLYEAGYTETINEEDLDKVLDIVNNFMNIHTCGSHIEELNYNQLTL